MTKIIAILLICISSITCIPGLSGAGRQAFGFGMNSAMNPMAGLNMNPMMQQQPGFGMAGMNMNNRMNSAFTGFPQTPNPSATAGFSRTASALSGASPLSPFQNGNEYGSRLMNKLGQIGNRMGVNNMGGFGMGNPMGMGMSMGNPMGMGMGMGANPGMNMAMNRLG